MATGSALADPAAPRVAGRRPRRRRRAHRLKPVVVVTVGVLGLLVVGVALLPVAGWQVVRLATGSMSPQYPPDSLLLAERIPADQARAGDIVMVQRPGSLPVTHRVVSTTPHGTATELVLKGDANPAPDPLPYDVATVTRVVAGVPWGGRIVTAARSPWALGGLTVAASLLVLWAWWPRGREPGRARHAPPHGG
jgi:signal peptidase